MVPPIIPRFQERLCSDDPLGRGFALVDGDHLGLGALLSGPLPAQEGVGDDTGRPWVYPLVMPKNIVAIENMAICSEFTN